MHDKHTYMTIFELQSIVGTGNPRPLYRFLKEKKCFDFETRELLISEKELKKEYKKYIKERKKAAYLSGNRGRPKKNA